MFLNDLKLKSKTCEFGTLCDSLITDRIIVGIESNSTKERLLREVNVTLERATEICRASEKSKLQSKALSADHSEDHHTDAIHTRKCKNGHKMCEWCNQRHKSGSRENFCPAYRAVCHKCHKRNHFSAACKTKGKQIDCVAGDCSSDSAEEVSGIDVDVFDDFFLD